MPIAAPYSPARMTAGNLASAPLKTVVGSNRQVYQRLKLAFKLGLRRQIFVAVCDDLTRRDGIAARLQAELTQELPLSSSYPAFVTLQLEDSIDLNPIAQVQNWFAKHPPQVRRRDVRMPGFQLLGVERLTRQPATVQWSFLNHLRETPKRLHTLNSSLLLWVSQPWLSSIEQSAPEFWQCCTGIFEFWGEPLSGEDELWENPESIEIKPISTEPTSPVKLPSPSTLKGQPPQKNPSSSQPSPFGNIDRDLVAQVLAHISPTDNTPSKSLELLEQIEQLHRLQASARLLAEHYQQLGDLYRDRIDESNPNSACIEVAILAYQQAIDFWEAMPSLQEIDRERVHSIFNDLGTLYWMLSRILVPPEAKRLHLEKSIDAYRHALQFMDGEHPSHSQYWIQNHLGGVYADLAQVGDGAENWQQAARVFESSLLGVKLEAQQYAATQDRLGTAYWNLAQYQQPVRFLKQAIAAYTEALHGNSGDSDALTYAAIQHNLGTAYWNLSVHEDPEVNLRLAIEAYCQALPYRTPEVCPVSCAVTHNNLGTALWQLANRSQDNPSRYTTLLEGAISAYETAIKLAQLLCTQTDLPPDAIGLTFDQFATHNNLGLAHYQLVTHPRFAGDAATRRVHLEASLHHHLQALSGWQSDAKLYQMALEFVVQTTRAFYNDGDIHGQNLAFSQLPPALLPEVMQLF